MNGKMKIALVVTSAIIVGAAIAYFTLSPSKKTLTPDQEAFLKTLNPAEREHFRQFIIEVEAKTGYKVVITDAYRSFARSAQYKEDDSRNASPGFSSHNYGLAIDLNLVKGSDVIRKADSRDKWIKSGIVAIAKKYGMDWGGDYNGYPDHVHFAYQKKYPTEKLYALALKQFGNDPNKIQGNQLKVA